MTHTNPILTYLYSVAPDAGGPPGSGRPRALSASHQKELSQTLLHKTGKALVVGLQGGAVHILDHCEGRQERTEEGFRGEKRHSSKQRGLKEETGEGDGGWMESMRQEKEKERCRMRG